MLNWRKDKEKKDESASPPPAARTPAKQVTTESASRSSGTDTGRMRLGELLVHENVISTGQLEEGLKRQRDSGCFLGQALVDLGYISQQTLVSFLVKQCKIPHISLADYVVTEDLFGLIPKELCREYNLLPIDKLGRILTVAMVDPMDVEALDRIRQTCPDLKIKPILCDWNHFDSVARKLFHEETKDAHEVTADSFGLTPQTTRKRAPEPESPGADAVDEAAMDAAVAAIVQEAAVAEKLSATRKQDEPKPRAQEPASRQSAVSGADIEAMVRSAVQAALAPAMREQQKNAEAQRVQLQSLIDTAKQAVAEAKSPGAEPAQNVEQFPRGRAADPLPPLPPLDETQALDSPGMGIDADDQVAEAIQSGGLQRGYTFESFAPGQANTFTFTLARSIAERLGSDGNPFFLFGGVGLGKSHLLNAIANTIRQKRPDARIHSTPAGRFSTDFEEAKQRGDLTGFRASYAKWDVIVMDDVQALSHKRDVQEELIHILDALTQSGRMVLLAAHSTPDQLEGFDQRLASRCCGGVVARLKAPEVEVRVALLKRIVERERVSVSDEVLNLIATRIANDVRKMTGALRKAVAYAKLIGKEVSREVAEEVLSHLGATQAA